MDQIAAAINPMAHKLYQEQTQSNLDDASIGGAVGGSFTGFIILCIAVYLAMKCRGGDHNMILHTIAAICCSPCYIVYSLILEPCKKVLAKS